MPRAGYSQQQADRMLNRGRVFYLTDTPAAVIVVGRENGTVVYNFLDDPADNRRSVGELRPRIKQIEDMHPDYLKRLEQGYKMKNGKWVAPNGISEEGVWYDTEEATTDISRFHGGGAKVYRRRRREMLARARRKVDSKSPAPPYPFGPPLDEDPAYDEIISFR